MDELNFTLVQDLKVHNAIMPLNFGVQKTIMVLQSSPPMTRKYEIKTLTSQLSDKQSQVQELTLKLNSSQGKVAILNSELNTKDSLYLQVIEKKKSIM